MAADLRDPSPAVPKARVFISYSRKDMAFADRLDAAIKVHGIGTLIDRAEIYAFEDWWKRIQALIAQADTVIFVLSPDSAASEVCAKEVAYALSLNKRFAPVVAKRVEDRLVPQALARLNFIIFDDEAKFDDSVNRLVEALTTDIDWIRQHTEFSETARHWTAAGRSNGLLLRPPLLEEAERWIASRPANAPEPTDETKTFVAASRSGATRRRNILTGSLASGLILALALAGLAYWQRGIAVENEALAVANDKAANSQRIENLKSGSRLVAVASHQLVDESRPDIAQAIALEGLPDPPGDRPFVDEAYKALMRGIRSDRSVALLTIGHEQFRSAAFAPDGKTLVTGTEGGKLVIWDVQTYQPRLQIDTGSTNLFKISVSSDGRSIIDSSDDHPTVWDLATGKLRLRIPKPQQGYAGRTRLSPDGTRIATGFSDNHAEIRDAATGEILYRLEGATDFEKAFSQRAQTDLKSNVYDADPIWKAAASSQWRMNGGMTEVLFSPNGKVLVVAGVGDPGGAARLYDVATGKLLAMLAGENLVLSLIQQRMAFSPDSSMLTLAGADNVVRVWDVSGGKLLFSLPHTAESHALTFDPTGSFLFVGYADGSVRVWGVKDGRILATFAAHVDAVTSIAFSPDGRTFATASNDRDVRLWWNTLDTEACGPSGRDMLCDTRLHAAAVLRGHADKITQVLFSADGRTLASIANDATVRIWRTGMTGEVALNLPREEQDSDDRCAPEKPPVIQQELPPPRKPTDEETRQKAIEVFGPAAANEDIAVLRQKLRQQAEMLVRGTAAQYGFTKDEIAQEDFEGLRAKLLVRINAAMAEQEEASRKACEFSKMMSGLSKQENMASGVFRRFSEQMGRTVDLPNGDDDAAKIAFEKDRTHLIVPNIDGDGFALLDITSGKALCRLQGRRLSLNAQDGSVMLHDGPLVAKPARCPSSDDAERLSDTSVSDDHWVMSPDGMRAAGSPKWLSSGTDADKTANDASMILIDTKSKRSLTELKADGRNAKSALFSEDGKIIIGALSGVDERNIADDSQYAVWNASTGSLYGVTGPGNGELHHVALAADGRRFVLAQDGQSSISLYFIDADESLKSRPMAGPSRDVSAVSISADGGTVAAAYIDGSIAFFSSHDGKLNATMPAGLYPITRLVFSPNGQVLAGADTKRTLWLWDIQTKAPIVVTSISGEPTALKFSPASDRVAVRTDKGEIRVLNVGLDYLGLNQPQDVIDWARASLSATLSEMDRQRFLLARSGTPPDSSRPPHLTNSGTLPVKTSDGRAGVSETNIEVPISGDDLPKLREQADQTALTEGVPGTAHALALAMKAANGNSAMAAFQIGLYIDRNATTDEARALAFFYLQLGERFAEANTASAAMDDLRDAAIARLKILPRQISPPTLVKVYRLARRWPFP